MHKYHSIEQFRKCIKEVQQYCSHNSLPLPTLKFKGSVKLHGTNAGVELPANIPQSRNCILTEQNNNFGFWTFHNERKNIFKKIYEKLNIPYPIVIYGEFAGKGIQQNVAISNIEKSFFIFGIKVITGEDSWYWLEDFNLYDNEEELDSLSFYKIYDLHGLSPKNLEIEIDFNSPELSVPKLQELTLSVEQECPIAKQFGFSGIGEGIVWEHITETGQMLSFKVKGEKHSSSKVKVLANVDVEKVNSVNEFVDKVLTESRLLQFYNELSSPTVKDIGTFLKNISNDILKEESDTLEESGLTMKDIGSKLSKQAKEWFMEKINESN
jgi:hypothetical protein